MTLAMNMEHYGLQCLEPAELAQTNGGSAAGLPKWVKVLGGWSTVIYLAENWPDIKQGLVDGWNFDKK